MAELSIADLVREAFCTTLLASAPILVLSLVTGLVLSVAQGAASGRELGLTFVPKLLVIAVATVLMLPWMMDMLTAWTTHLVAQVLPLVLH